MVPIVLIWQQFRTAEQRLQEAFAESAAPENESRLRSSPAVDDTVSGKVDSSGVEAAGEDESERGVKKCVDQLEMVGSFHRI
jgi:hypothetical protein